MSQTVIVAIITAIVAVLTSSVLWAGVTALVNRLRFGGISVGIVPATGGAIGLYADGVKGFSIRLRIANVTSQAIAVERIDVLMQLKPRPQAPKVHLARGSCTTSVIRDGPYGTDLNVEGYPVVVPGNGGQLYLELNADMDMQYYRKSRRHLVVPLWTALEGLGIDDPAAPTDPDGDRMYFDYFDSTSLQLSLQVNGKARRLPVHVWERRETSGSG